MKERSGKKGIWREGEPKRNRKRTGKRRKWTKERSGFRKKEKHSGKTEEGMRMIRGGGEAGMSWKEGMKNRQYSMYN